MDPCGLISNKDDDDDDSNIINSVLPTAAVVP